MTQLDPLAAVPRARPASRAGKVRDGLPRLALALLSAMASVLSIVIYFAVAVALAP